jgi:hypothetical protein
MYGQAELDRAERDTFVVVFTPQPVTSAGSCCCL